MEEVARRDRRRSHAVALGSVAVLAVAFGVLLVGDADGVAFVPIIAGLSPAIFLLLTRKTPNRVEIALWWVGAIALVLFSALVTRSAVTERRLMARQESCVLRPLDFDNDRVATMRVEWWPPQVQCRYGYSYQQAEDVVWESRWWIYWPIVLVPLSGLMVAGVARQSWRRRSDHRLAPTGQ